MGAALPRSGLGRAAEAIGDTEALDLLSSLVAIAPTNLEDPIHGRFEKPNYGRAVDRIVRAARSFGLTTRIYDPVFERPEATHLRGMSRPNVLVDLDVGASERVLILAHYDVVPVPAEQLGRWKSSPHTLTLRDDGRLYGRGANDDLGSGVVTSLLAMRRLADRGDARRNVRLLVCCDEETGGEGGVEELKNHDDALAPEDPGRFLFGDVALIPDGSPHTTAASSGVAFLDAETTSPATVGQVAAFGEVLVGLHELARTWRSVYPSPDWPDELAPEPVLTGRATLTKVDFAAAPGTGELARVAALHAEADAANQIPESVTVVLTGPTAALSLAHGRLRGAVRSPYVVAEARATSLVLPPGSVAVQVIGTSAHGGYPHRGHNPVPETLRLLALGVREGWIEPGAPGRATFSVDLRLTPEMALAEGTGPALARIDEGLAAARILGRAEAPAGRCRPGYALALTHPALHRLERILTEEGGERGIFGEYGGTDASTLGTVRTPKGAPLPAIVFGSMDRAARIHDAEESVDPRLLGVVARAIHRFVQEP